MLYIKTAIFLLIFLISTAIGMMMSKKYSGRVKDLREIKNGLNIFKSKIKFTYEPIVEIFEELSRTSSGEVSNLFKLAYENMDNTTAGEAWNYSLENTNSNLNDEDKDILRGLSKLLGKTDADGQVSEIDLTLSFLDSQIDKAEKERVKNEKLYKTLGAITGLGIVIILI